MGQNEVYEILKRERDKGNDGYLSIAQVYRRLYEENSTAPKRQSVYNSVKKLERLKVIEVRSIGEWPAYFRLKKKG